jgi:hypothetical protein
VSSAVRAAEDLLLSDGALAGPKDANRRSPANRLLAQALVSTDALRR